MEKIFKTTEIHLASSLLCSKGFQLVCITTNDKDELEFNIKYSNKKKLLQLLTMDLENNLNVDFEKFRGNMIFLNQQIQIYNNENYK